MYYKPVAPVDHSMSDSSQGEFYNGGYTEAVIGYGSRPVRNDRCGGCSRDERW